MKSRLIMLVSAAVLFATTADAANFSVYMNQENSNNCAIGNLSGISANPDGNLVATTTAPTFSAPCGISGTGPTATLTVSPTPPTKLTAGQAATIVWTANHVTSCNITGTDASVATEFPNAWTNSVVTCTGNQCAGGANTVQATSITNGTDQIYNFGIQCLNGTNSGVFATASAQVTGSGGGNPPPGPTCTQGATGDLTMGGVASTCTASGSITWYNGVKNILPISPYSYTYVFGGTGYPGSRKNNSEVFVVGKNNFISIPFTPGASLGAHYEESETYTTSPITITVSTGPGLFGNGTSGTGVICGQSGGNPSIITSTTIPEPAGTNCELTAGQTYWLNIASAQYNPGTGAWINTCQASSCSIGITMGLAN